MAERVEIFQFTVPAGTSIGSPVTQNLDWPDGIIRRFEFLIPPGPSGFMGFRVRQSQQVVIPNTVNTWIVADDQTIEWDVSGFPTGNKWSIQGYNTGDFDHTVYGHVLLDEIPTPVGAAPVAFAIE